MVVGMWFQDLFNFDLTHRNGSRASRDREGEKFPSA